jgi:hypothetical protein
VRLRLIVGSVIVAGALGCGALPTTSGLNGRDGGGGAGAGGAAGSDGAAGAGGAAGSDGAAGAGGAAGADAAAGTGGAVGSDAAAGAGGAAGADAAAGTGGADASAGSDGGADADASGGAGGGNAMACGGRSGGGAGAGGAGGQFALTGRYGDVAALFAGEVNGDCKVDLIGYGTPAAGDLAVWRGRGDGTFVSTPVVTHTGWTDQGVVLGDFNADGRTDVALVVTAAVPGTPTQASQQVRIWLALARADATFAVSAVSDPAGGGFGTWDTVYSLCGVADFNGDGRADLAFAGNQLMGTSRALSAMVLAGQPPNSSMALSGGAATTGVGLGLNGSVGFCAPPGDVDGDGKVDVLVSITQQGLAGGAQQNVTALYGKGDATFKPASASSFVPALAGMYGFSILDVDKDGHPDVAVSGPTSKIFWGDAGGTFATSTPVALGVFADFDADGKMDVTGFMTGNSHIFYGDGARHFDRMVAVPDQAAGNVADLNNDGAADLFGVWRAAQGAPSVTSIYVSTARGVPVGSPDIQCGAVPAGQCTGPTVF